MVHALADKRRGDNGQSPRKSTRQRLSLPQCSRRLHDLVVRIVARSEVGPVTAFSR